MSSSKCRADGNAFGSAEERYKRHTLKRLIAALVTSFFLLAAHAETDFHAIQVETLLQSTQAWDGSPYSVYPAGMPQLSVLKITIPARTTMSWHTHPMPNVGYIIAGELTIEKQDGSAKHFTTGQVVPETVDTVHHGITGDKPVELVVFYAGAAGMPLSKDRVEGAPFESAKSTTDVMVTHAHVTSTPAGADIHVDGSYVGATPSDIDLTCCWHDMTISKPGLKPWTRRLRNTGGQVNITADLQK
jgi:quercetin dioxygenase-like cupin family protein